MGGILTIGARVIERLLPFLGRVAKSSPETWTKIVNALKSANVAGAETAAGIVAYARANPVNAALVFSTIASLGVSVSDLFSSEDKADPEVRATAAALDGMMLGDVKIKSLIAKNAAASENLKFGFADREVENGLLADICNWAKEAFGTKAGALRAHGMLQAFVEVPYADLEAGFRRLK